jgi:hypothetical protein
VRDRTRPKFSSIGKMHHQTDSAPIAGHTITMCTGEWRVFAITTPCFAFMVCFFSPMLPFLCVGNLCLPVFRQYPESASLTKCLYSFPAVILSCQQRNISLNRVASIKRRLMLLQARNLHLIQPLFHDAILAKKTFR